MSIVPNADWSQQTTGGYDDGQQTTGQTFGCYACAQVLNLEVPKTIYMVSGTTVCAEHLSTLMGGQ